MRTSSILQRLVMLSLFPWIASPLVIDGRPAVSEMSGTWIGSGEIIVSWTVQRRLSVELTILPDLTVHGRVGDAELRDGRLRPHTSWLGRALHVKTDSMIVGRLDGCIVASEGICRDSVKIPLHRKDGGFAGSLHTSGAKVGGKDRMILTVARLSLSRRTTE